MTKVATRFPRLGDLIQNEHASQVGFCRKEGVANETAETVYEIGRVLGKTLASGAATDTPGAANTGDGVMGSVTVAATAKLGSHRLEIVTAAADAGDFVVTDPLGNVIGTGTVAVAFSAGGLSFTLADGAADFVVGDYITIDVTGTETYKTIEASAIDGSAVFAGIYIGGKQVDNSQTLLAATDTDIAVLYRGPVTIGEDLLVFGATVVSDAQKDAIKDQMRAVGFKIQKQPNQFA